MESSHGTRQAVNPHSKSLTLATLCELVGVDELRPNGAAYGWCPAHENPHAFRLRIGGRTPEGFVKIQCRGGGCREAMIAEALTRRTGRQVAVEDLLNVKDET